jgi:magnesium-transporting ATPase (P-type)
MIMDLTASQTQAAITEGVRLAFLDALKQSQSNDYTSTGERITNAIKAGVSEAVVDCLRSRNDAWIKTGDALITAVQAGVTSAILTELESSEGPA